MRLRMKIQISAHNKSVTVRPSAHWSLYCMCPRDWSNKYATWTYCNHNLQHTTMIVMYV